MATRFGIRNYSRNGDQVTFTVVALNADGSIDTGYAGTFTVGASNLTGLPANYTFTGTDQGQRVFTATITNQNTAASAAAVFPGSTGTGANLHIAPPAGTNTSFFFSGDHVMHGGAGNDIYNGGGGNDLMRLELGGNDTVNGNGGDDGFYFGAAYTVDDRVIGGDGVDSIGLQGNYAGVTLGSMLTTESVTLLSGSDRRYGGTGNLTHSYNLVADANTIVSDNRLTIQGNALGTSEPLTFNGSATAIDFLIYGGRGQDRLTGGSGNDGFFFGQSRWGSTDSINGGAGTFDQVGLQGTFNTSFNNNQLSGVEYIVLLSASDARFPYSGAVSYTIRMSNGNVQAGERMVIQGNTLQASEPVIFFGALELDGSYEIYSGAANDFLNGSQGADEIYGGAGTDYVQGHRGADILYGGADNDLFLYGTLLDSTASGRDQIRDFERGDKIDLSALVPFGNGSFSFVGSDAPTGANQIQVLQNGTSATINLFHDGDSIADLVIDVTVLDSHALTIADFILPSAVPAAEPGAAGADPIDLAPGPLLPFELRHQFDSLHAYGTTHDLLI